MIFKFHKVPPGPRPKATIVDQKMNSPEKMHNDRLLTYHLNHNPGH